MPKRKAQPARANAASRVFGSAGDEHALRRIKRHLEDLERTNYTESSGRAGAWRGGALGGVEPLADEGESLGGSALVSDETGKKRKQTPNVRALLMYHRNLTALLEEANFASFPDGTSTYLTAAAAPSTRPPAAVCTVCGTFGKYRCGRCRLMVCSTECQATHDEARCERRIL